MIRPEELRIGNYVLMEKEDGGFRHMPIEQGREIDNAEKFLPVPLTDEILHRCGFVGGIKGDFHLSLFGEEAAGYVVYFGEEWLCHVIYLHQLQNIYFAVTGEDVDILQ